MENLEALMAAVHTLVVKVEQIPDSHGVPCTKSEAQVIAAALIQLLALNHPLRGEYTQDLLDNARYTCDRSNNLFN